MKTKIILYILSIITLFSLGYYTGYTSNQSNDTKNYEAACLQADFIRFMIDQWNDEEIWNGGVELENSYEEYFQELSSGNFKTKYIKDIRDFDKYFWCY